jgi:hypothetical protein
MFVLFSFRSFPSSFSTYICCLYSLTIKVGGSLDVQLPSNSYYSNSYYTTMILSCAMRHCIILIKEIDTFRFWKREWPLYDLTYKVPQLTVHVRAKISHEVEGIVHRALRQHSVFNEVESIFSILS